MDIVTVSDIANKLDIDRDAVAYAIRKAGVEPLGRAGIVRLFPGSAVGTVKRFIRSKRQYRREAIKCTA
ncbi:MAG: hypothetical protein JXM79_18580 [Sedimentisphaerales bacterium]|nr:hypothetical protein [Sedimentisphaerales bacterium]